MSSRYDPEFEEIIRTLPEDQWPLWVANRYRAMNHGQAQPLQQEDQGVSQYPQEWLTNDDLYYESKWKIGGRPDAGFEDWVCPNCGAQGRDEVYEDPMGGYECRMCSTPIVSKVAAGAGLPANYTPADPYDIQGKMPLINAMEVPWWNYPPEQGKQVVANAFRATMLSPRMNLKSNAILYQSLMDIPAEESDPDVFENRVRALKQKWDAEGQTDLFTPPEESTIDPKDQLPGKFLPGFWGNIRRLANLGPYIDEIYAAAMDDMAHGGTGQRFRQKVLDLGLPGVQAKVASFAWLALAPNTSDLGTMDVHMMRHLNQDEDSPRNTQHYLDLENQLRNEKDETYGTEVPLSHYQWAVWDARRTPGFHQDHTPLKAHQPTPYTEVHWPPTARPARPRPPVVAPEGQMSLLGKWTRLPAWSRIVTAAPSYTVQGEIVGGLPSATAQGIAVRPDRQSQAEIMDIIQGLSTHQDDAQKQRELIPGWALNRGAKTADFREGPGGVGVTYAPGVICVSSWVNTNDNWLLLHPACVGIVAEKGGGSSHGVTIARQRGIAIVVNAPGASQIQPGDELQVLSENALVHVNGGEVGEFGAAATAAIPIIRFVWSQGERDWEPVPQPPPPDAPETGVTHPQMIAKLKRAGRWNKNDSALGIIYPDGKVQMESTASDEEQMFSWLNTLHPTTTVERDFSL